MMMNTDRLRELVDRLIACGPKAAHVSASETHEIHDEVVELIAERDALVLALTETLEWALPTHDNGRQFKKSDGLIGYTVELISQFTRIGDRHRDDRLTALAKLIAPSEDDA